MRLDQVLDRPALNFMIHTSPIGEEITTITLAIEIIRTDEVAGLNGARFYINPTPRRNRRDLARSKNSHGCGEKIPLSNACCWDVRRDLSDSAYLEFGGTQVPRESLQNLHSWFESHPRLQILALE